MRVGHGTHERAVLCQSSITRSDIEIKIIGADSETSKSGLMQIC